MTEEIVASKMPRLASQALRPTRGGYGQNAFGGPSSDTPGNSTVSDFLPGADLSAAQDDRRNIQQRPIKADALPTTFGNHKPSNS